MMMKWTNSKQMALNALLTSPSVRAAAAGSGIAERTFFNYLNEKEFTDRLAAARHEATQGIIHLLRSNMESAIDTIVHLHIHSEDERVRLAAARELLAHGMNTAIISSLTDRLDFWERETGVLDDVQDD